MKIHREPFKNMGSINYGRSMGWMEWVSVLLLIKLIKKDNFDYHSHQQNTGNSEAE